MDYRKFIECLKNKGLLKTVTRSVNWKYEIGQIVRSGNSPIIFENIEGYKRCRLFSGGFSRIESIALALDITPDVSPKGLIAAIKSRVKNSITPVMVECFDKRDVVNGKGVNLFSLPVPWWHYGDGGRYIGTWHINVSKSPLNQSRNCGVYRMQLLSSNSTTISVSTLSHLARNISEAEKLGRDLEMAVAIGIDEAVVMAGAASVPYGVDEFSVAGALQNKPVHIVKCTGVDLEVPVNAEYVLEGVIKRGVRVTDGPYFDYTGTCNVNEKAFLFEVRTITQRVDPIFRGMSVGVAGAEDHRLFYLLSQVGLTDFHSSKIKQKIQNFFLRHGYFRLFQYTGRVGGIIKNMIRSKDEK